MTPAPSAESAGVARSSLVRFAWLSVGAAVLTIALKAGAYLLTGSVGLLSDAAESVVNLVAAFVALFALRVSARPADQEHHFGHAKAEYFSAAIEGFMIFVAAVFIIYAAVGRLLDPQPLENVGLGLAVSCLASTVNGVVAVVLMRAGRRHRSLTLVADGKHLMTDVWTSAGVVLGVLLVALTGIERLDPAVAIAVGLNIVVTGVGLVRQSVSGLMDAAWPDEDNAQIHSLISDFETPEVTFHGLRTRQSGHDRFAEVHVLVPGEWSVQRGHDLVEDIEEAVRSRFAEVVLMCHLEPREDPRSYDDYPAEVAAPAPGGDGRG